MKTTAGVAPVERFLATMRIVHSEGRHLSYSWTKLFAEPIDAAWVIALDARPDLAERVEAFASRFGRMQDTIGDKLIPRWLLAVAETPGSMIENLGRAERLGVLPSVERWLEARSLRNRLIHEYVESPEALAADLVRARDYAGDLFAAYERIRVFALTRMGLPADSLPVLPTPAQREAEESDMPAVRNPQPEPPSP